MIEPVANITCGLFVTGEKDVLLDWNKTEKAQKIMDEEQNNMSVGQISGLYTEKQMQEYAESVQEQLNTAKKALTEISRSTVNEIRANFWDDEGSADLITVKSKEAKIASKALAEIG